MSVFLIVFGLLAFMIVVSRFFKGRNDSVPHGRSANNVTLNTKLYPNLNTPNTKTRPECLEQAEIDKIPITRLKLKKTETKRQKPEKKEKRNGKGEREVREESVNGRQPHLKIQDHNTKGEHKRKSKHKHRHEHKYKYKEKSSNISKIPAIVCVLCSMNISIQSYIRKLPCKDVFHLNCLDYHLSNLSKYCPTCNFDLKSAAND